MALKYEFHESTDVPGLDRLWAEATDWGEGNFQSLHRWFLDAPFGKPRIVVATDTGTGEIVGQFRFMPCRVSVDGREVRAIRPFGTIVSKAMREAVDSNNPFDLPAVAMYNYAVTNLQAMGEELIYMVPDPRWVRLFRMFPFIQCDSYPLWSLRVPLSDPLLLGPGYTAGPLEAWDERVDRLWKQASRLHGCMVVRDIAALRWKTANAEYHMTAVTRGEELAGLVASRRKGDRQWLICDMLTADSGDALRATLAAACNVAHAESLAAAEDPIHKVAVLLTPLMEEAVRSLGFARDAYDFPIAVHILDPSISREEVAPSRWYVSAND